MYVKKYAVTCDISYFIYFRIIFSLLKNIKLYIGNFLAESRSLYFLFVTLLFVFETEAVSVLLSAKRVDLNSFLRDAISNRPHFCFELNT